MKREYKYPYVQLTSDGVVQNIAMFDDYEQANVITRAVYGEDAFAMAYNYGVGIGDKLVDGIFYVVNEDGTLEEAEYIPNDEDNIRSLKSENEDLTLAMAEMIGGGI